MIRIARQAKATRRIVKTLLSENLTNFSHHLCFLCPLTTSAKLLNPEYILAYF
jgi:hypothetical protein